MASPAGEPDSEPLPLPMSPSPLSPSTRPLLPTPSSRSSPPIPSRPRRRLSRRLKSRLLRRPRSTPLRMLRRSPFRSDRLAPMMLPAMRTAVPSRNRIGIAFVCHSAPVAFLVCGKRGWGTFCFSAALYACCAFQMGEDEGQISEKTRCDGGGFVSGRRGMLITWRIACLGIWQKCSKMWRSWGAAADTLQDVRTRL